MEQWNNGVWDIAMLD